MHGSSRCFKKFLSSAKFYKADIIILAGDLTGKMIVPIVTQPDGSVLAQYMDRTWVSKTSAEVESLEKEIRDSGYYPYRTTPVEVKQLTENKTKLEYLFSKVMMDSLREWVRLAEDRLRGTNVRCYISPGNDDSFDIDSALANSDYVINPEGTVVQLDDHHEMITCGWSNPTPWKTPRECAEDELYAKIESIASKVSDVTNCIFNLHCPPYDTRLDVAPKLDNTLKPVISEGQMITGPVGSTAVRSLIEKHQPLLGLHGHIHESKGTCRLGRTLCINPGSEYSYGVLNGAVVNLTEGAVKGHQMVSG